MAQAAGMSRSALPPSSAPRWATPGAYLLVLARVAGPGACCGAGCRCGRSATSQLRQPGGIHPGVCSGGRDGAAQWLKGLCRRLYNVASFAARLRQTTMASHDFDITHRRQRPIGLSAALQLAPTPARP